MILINDALSDSYGTARVVLAVVTTILTGCGAETGGEAPLDDAAGAGTTTEAVRGGVVYRQAGAWEAIGHIGGCTATLISPYAALTAGHCVTDGSRRTFTLPNGRGSITGTVLLHPQYEAIKLRRL